MSLCLSVSHGEFSKTLPLTGPFHCTQNRVLNELGEANNVPSCNDLNFLSAVNGEVNHMILFVVEHLSDLCSEQNNNISIFTSKVDNQGISFVEWI